MTYARPFHLHHSGGTLDGAAFPSGHAIVIDDPTFGFASTAPTLDQLLLGYHRARIEWADTPVQAPGPVTGSPLVDPIAAALYERERPADDPHWREAYEVDREVFSDMAGTVLAVVQPAAQRVTDLYERWVKAGPPPLGASMARWWDERLAELRAALHTPGEDGEVVACPSCLGAPPIPRAQLADHNRQHHPHHPQEQP